MVTVPWPGKLGRAVDIFPVLDPVFLWEGLSLEDADGKIRDSRPGDRAGGCCKSQRLCWDAAAPGISFNFRV